MPEIQDDDHLTIISAQSHAVQLLRLLCALPDLLLR